MIGFTKKKRILAFSCLLLSTALFGEDMFHTVQSGDTVYSLARKYGIKAEEILFLNGVEDPRKIQAGQVLRIPSGPITAAPIDLSAPSFTEHTVKKGETLTGIARSYKISLNTLRSTNNLKSDTLRPGDVLKIPGDNTNAAAPPPAKTLSAGTVQKSPANNSGGFDWNISWPITVREAAYMTGKLNGVVLTGEKSEQVKNLVGGTVVSAMPYRGFGKVVIIKTAANYLYVYGGLESISVSVGSTASSGTELGKLGIDAVSGRPQLFFMVYQDTNAIDPVKAPRG